jgi:hypothetical protein
MADVRLVASTGATIWRGRLEDIAVERQGVSLTAFGYSRAFGDIKYTALWSSDTSADFRPILENEVSIYRPDRAQSDNNNRVYLAVKKDHSTSNDTRLGMVYELPDKGLRDVVTLSFDYTIAGAGTGGGAKEYRLLAGGFNTSWALVTSAGYSVADNAPVSASVSVTMGAAVQKVWLAFSYNSATEDTYTGETGDEAYAIVTNVRIKTTSVATVLGSDIAAGLLANVASVNPSQISTTTLGIVPTTLDLQGMIFEDEQPANILNELCDIHGYRWQVWDKELVFEPNTTEQQTYYIDAQSVEVQQSLDSVSTRAYAVYQTDSNRRVRTPIASNLAAYTAFGVNRDVTTSAQTTSQTEAESWRDTLLADSANLVVRARVTFDRLLSTTGQIVPLWSIRAGDKIVIRNVPLGASFGTGIGEFIVAQTDFDAINNTITVEPDVPYPSMVSLVAKQGKTK